MTEPMSLILLVVAGIAAGLASTLAGLASVVSYPALLAFGLPPVAANVTNTTAMTGVIAGSALGARQELRDHWPLLTRLALAAGLGGAAGAGLLLVTPSDTFTAIVPFFVALGSVLLLCRDVLRRRLERRAVGAVEPDPPTGARVRMGTPSAATASSAEPLIGGEAEPEQRDGARSMPSTPVSAAAWRSRNQGTARRGSSRRSAAAPRRVTTSRSTDGTEVEHESAVRRRWWTPSPDEWPGLRAPSQRDLVVRTCVDAKARAFR